MVADLIIVSDLHLGEGCQDGVRFSPNEDFFHDEDFARFLEHLQSEYRGRPNQLKLIFNGDTFDFLTVTRVPGDDVARTRGFAVSDQERRFGLEPIAPKAVYKLDVIARGHKLFFKALGRFLQAGFSVVFIRGNHDLELYFDDVQKRLLQILSSVDGGTSLSAISDQVTFEQLFYREPGRIHVEHGHQYDAANSQRYPLCPVVPTTDDAHLPSDTDGGERLDYPLGSVFVKYFYNHVRRLDPYAPRLISPDQYLDFFRRYNLFDVVRVYRKHYPNFIAAFAPGSQMGRDDLSRKGRVLLAQRTAVMAEKTGVSDFYDKWDKLKRSPKSANRLAIVRHAIRPFVRRFIWGSAFLFVVLYFWLLFFFLIQEIPSRAANTFLMSVFAALSVISAVVVWSHLKGKLRQRTVQKSMQLLDKVRSLAALSEVPIVAMGHNHRAEMRHVGFKADKDGPIFINSGTWTRVSNPWRRLIDDARQLTFCRIKGSSPELLRWGASSDRIERVPLFEEADAALIPIGWPDDEDDPAVRTSILPGIPAPLDADEKDEESAIESTDHFSDPD